jgi:hypothetical protein
MSSETILEKDKRLSNSILWKLQQEAYSRYGIEAWNQYGVPSYITSNSYTARAYAHVALGYIRDGIAHDTLDLSQPLYFLDLGAGTGRFTYFFLNELSAFLSSSSLPKIKICYVMTGMVASNLEFWQTHSYLKPYFESGILDRALYHHAQKAPIHLINRNIILSTETVINPLILICNYFFDTIPQDLFRFKNGMLEEGRIALTVNNAAEEEIASLNPSLINKLSYQYSYHPFTDECKTGYSEKLRILLDSFRDKLEGCSFLFPSGAFEALETFIDLSQSRLLLLAGDQGLCTVEQLRQSGEPKLSLHGSFSFPVSYFAMAAFFQQQSGKYWLTSFSDPTFVIMAAVLGLENAPETTLAFHEHIDNFEPTDYFKLVSLTEEQSEEQDQAPSLDYILLLIKLGNWDASVLLGFFSAIRQALPSATQPQKDRLQATIGEVYKHFYPTGPSSGDFVLNLGVLLFEMQDFAGAKKYFQASMEITGSNTTALNNITACNLKLKL